MIEFNERSRAVTVNKALEEFGLDLKTVEFLLYEVKTRFNLTHLKRSIPQIEEDIRRLNTIKESANHLVENFTKSSRLNEYLKQKCPEKAASNKKLMNGLEDFFIAIDRRIKILKKTIVLFKNLDNRLKKEKTLLQPQTLVILVWFTAMNNGPGNINDKYKTVETLLKWLSKHRRDLLKETIGRERIFLSREAIRRDNERYMLKPIRQYRVYSDLVFSILADIMPEEGSSVIPSLSGADFVRMYRRRQRKRVRLSSRRKA
jgi:hypothetical protein